MPTIEFAANHNSIWNNIYVCYDLSFIYALIIKLHYKGYNNHLEIHCDVNYIYDLK